MTRVNLGRDTSGRPLVVDRTFLDKLRLAEARLGWTFTIIQGSWRGDDGAAASGNTHARGGVGDLRSRDLPARISIDRALRELRRAGLLAWYRTPAQGFAPHFHVIDLGNPALDPSAAQQVDAWRTGRNGLASGGLDDGPKVPIPSGAPSWTREASWNLKVGRNASVVAGEVWDLIRTEDLGYLYVQEAAGYIKALREKLKPKGYRVRTFAGRGVGAKDSAIISRKPARRRLIGLGGVRWERKPGRPGLHNARAVVAVLAGGVRRASVHIPPGPYTDRFPLRRKARNAALRKLTRVGRRWTKRGRAWLMPGDWNTPAGETGANTPRRMANELGADVTGNGIDYVISRGFYVIEYRRGPKRGSDHAPILFRTHPKGD